MTFNGPLDLLIYHMVEFRRRSASGFFEQKRAIIADFPDHTPDRIRTFFCLSGINFTSFCPELTISASLIIPKNEFITSGFRCALCALQFSKKRGHLRKVPSPKSENNPDLAWDLT
jgi:hypothetical protein